MFKRGLDLIVSFVLLLLLVPVLVLLVVIIRFRLGSPAMFCQMRPGLHGKPFKMVKFRSMVDAADEYGNQLPDAQRLTRFGKLLRATSLDELPELWNVLIGDMSLVGPRPLMMEYLPLYNDEQRRRHDVRPGITGWAQINGRNTLSWEDKFKHDVWYVDHISFGLDMKILILTLQKVIQREGIQGEGEVTASKFMGASVSD